jgi:hypothetical protein
MVWNEGTSKQTIGEKGNRAQIIVKLALFVVNISKKNEMERDFRIFYEALIIATRNVLPKYFQLPVAYRDFVLRERSYCYELYHRISQILPEDFAYTLSGEINKAGHPNIAPFCGDIIPDFLIHNPGRMGPEDNLVIMEVKTIDGAYYNRKGRGIQKDFSTINCMTSLPNGYFRGIMLVFGGDNPGSITEISRIYRERCNPENVILLFHKNAGESAILG